MDSEAIYKMKCNEVLNFVVGGGYGIDVIRVPGGWVYRTGNAIGIAQCFVPWNDEFKPSEGCEVKDAMGKQLDHERHPY